MNLVLATKIEIILMILYSITKNAISKSEIEPFLYHSHQGPRKPPLYPIVVTSRLSASPGYVFLVRFLFLILILFLLVPCFWFLVFFIVPGILVFHLSYNCVDSVHCQNPSQILIWLNSPKLCTYIYSVELPSHLSLG